MPDETLPPENAAPVTPGETEPEETHEAPANQTTISEYLESLLVTVILALFGTSFVVQAFKIPSQSMERTLLVGDHLLVNKFSGTTNFCRTGRWSAGTSSFSNILIRTIRTL
jgi:signal peptidase I